MKFRKKPVVIEAVRWDGDNVDEVGDFMGLHATMSIDGAFVIPTLEGDMLASEGDWIIKEPFATDDRRFYPCKPDIFEATYEAVE